MADIGRKQFDEIYQEASKSNEAIDAMVESQRAQNYQGASNILSTEDLAKTSLKRPGEFVKNFYEGIKGKPITSALGAIALIPAGFLIEAAIVNLNGNAISQGDARQLGATALTVGVGLVVSSVGFFDSVYKNGAKKRLSKK